MNQHTDVCHLYCATGTLQISAATHSGYNNNGDQECSNAVQESAKVKDCNNQSTCTLSFDGGFEDNCGDADSYQRLSITYSCTTPPPSPPPYCGKFY